MNKITCRLWQRHLPKKTLLMGGWFPLSLLIATGLDTPVMSNLKDYFKIRWSSWLRLVICIIGEAFVFLVWILVAALCQWVAACLERNGLREVFADIFRWASSIGTLVLAVVYILVDIMDEVKRLFPR